MSERLAPAKVNLALVVGPTRPDGRHEVVTVLQRLALADTIRLEEADSLSVDGFAGDTLVRSAVRAVAGRAGVEPRWRATIEKRIPVAAGLGGGSSDAAAALLLANESLASPLAEGDLHAVASKLGADVPFFLTTGPQLGEGDGTRLTPLDLPQDFWVLLALPHGTRKASTASVYAAFDRIRGDEGFEQRRAELLRGLALGDIGSLPANDLASSPLAERLVELGAIRADVSGAGPAVYALFEEEADAVTAAASLRGRADLWITTPGW